MLVIRLVIYYTFFNVFDFYSVLFCKTMFFSPSSSQQFFEIFIRHIETCKVFVQVFNICLCLLKQDYDVALTVKCSLDDIEVGSVNTRYNPTSFSSSKKEDPVVSAMIQKLHRRQLCSPPPNSIQLLFCLQDLLPLECFSVEQFRTVQETLLLFLICWAVAAKINRSVIFQLLPPKFYYSN